MRREENKRAHRNIKLFERKAAGRKNTRKCTRIEENLRDIATKGYSGSWPQKPSRTYQQSISYSYGVTAVTIDLEK